MKKNYNNSLIIITGVISIIAFILSYLTNYEDSFFTSTVLGIIGFISLAFTLSSLLGNTGNQYGYTYKIAVLGHSKAGKTTIITVLLGLIMYRKKEQLGFNNDYEIHLTGASTIEKVTADWSILDQRTPLKSTTDQDKFAYSLRLEKKLHLSVEKYNIEVADFPGIYSEEMSLKEENQQLLRSNFFLWSKEAEAFMYVIDLERYLISKSNNNNNNYTNEMVNFIGNSWATIKEHNINSKKDLAKVPVLVLFNKFDLLLDDLSHNKNNYLPTIKKYDDPKSSTQIRHEVIEDFKDIKGLFDGYNWKFEFCSNFLENPQGIRVGHLKIIRHLFPVN